MTSRATPLPPTTPSDSLSLNLHAPGAPNRSTCSPRRVVPLPRARARASIRDTLATVSTRPAIPALGRPTPSLPAPPKKPARQPRSDKAELDALALALYHIAAGAISPPSPMPPPPFKPASPLKPTAVPLPCPAVAAAPPTPASVSMSPQTTKSTLVESDGDSTGADHHTAAPAPSAVAAELRSILQRTEPAESSALGNPSRLFDCLASALFMNGPEDDTLAGAGCSHPHSVWKELDDVSHSGPQAGQSIMICCDIPIDGLPSIVALAERQNHPHRGLHVHKGSPSAAKHEHRPSGVFRWPFGKKNRMRSGQQDVTVDEPLSVWYPSSTQMSLHATWWGYSIYLPPPVMKELNADGVDTLRRVAAFSAALKFILDRLPSLFLLSPPLLVAVGLLQGLAPIVGYIASFVSYSWSHVKSFDRGRGVVLSATWALPVALIPRAWDAPSPPLPASADASTIITALHGLHLQDFGAGQSANQSRSPLA